MTTTQLDLFGEVEAAVRQAVADDTERRRAALLVLRDHVRHALEIVIGERRPDTGEIKTNLNHPWAYSTRRAGFYFEHEETWDGWYARPKHLLTWEELDDLVASDPRIEGVRAWSASLTAIDAWKDRGRPYELDSEPDTWHPSYIEGDHGRAGWTERLAAWRVVLDVLTDAAAQQCAGRPDKEAS